jgi:hypothetical protein
MSRIIANNIRHNDATVDNITLDSAGNATVDGTLTATSFSGDGSALTGIDVTSVTGNLTVTSGNLVLSSGNGIDFSAAGNVAGMTSELLDDYEEGTFTPRLMIGAAQQTLDVSYGVYRKIGNLVFVKCHVSASSISGSGGVEIRDLPFAQASGGLSQTALSVQWSGILNEYAVYANTNSSTRVQFAYSTASGNTGTLQNTDIAAQSNFGIAGCYEVS